MAFNFFHLKIKSELRTKLRVKVLYGFRPAHALPIPWSVMEPTIRRRNFRENFYSCELGKTAPDHFFQVKVSSAHSLS